MLPSAVARPSVPNTLYIHSTEIRRRVSQSGAWVTIRNLLVAVMSILLPTSCAQERVCDFQAVNQDHHSSSSQRVLVEMEELLRSHSVGGGVKVGVELVVSQLELTRDGKRGRRLFYVLKDESGRLVDASTCGVDEGKCASVIVGKMVDYCER